MFRLCVGTMLIRWRRFNINLTSTTLLLAFLTGCATLGAKSQKQIAALRVHLEVKADGTDRNTRVPIYRSNPIMINVEISPFLNEADVTQASLVDSLGGFQMVIQFDKRGTRLLEQFSATNPGKHFAIAAEFAEKTKQSRWLAAPIVVRRIPDGVLAFTPDTTRAEAEEIVRGLNNVAIQNGNQKKPKATAK